MYACMYVRMYVRMYGCVYCARSHEIHTQGDAFECAFVSVVDAVNFALDVQVATLHSHGVLLVITWGSLSTHMGVRVNFGLDVRVKTLRSVAHPDASSPLLGIVAPLHRCIATLHCDIAASLVLVHRCWTVALIVACSGDCMSQTGRGRCLRCLAGTKSALPTAL